jgi:H+/Cl- antiporter ClcA
MRRSSGRELGVVRRIVGMLALILAAYCLIAAATELYAQPAPDRPNPEALAARERHPWLGLIPVVFLGLVVAYAVVVAARRRGRLHARHGPPSTQDPPPRAGSEAGAHRDTPSR